MLPSYVYRPPAHYYAPQLYRRVSYEQYSRNWLYDPSSEQVVTLGALEPDSPFNGISPAVVVGDLWVLKLVTSPDGAPLTPLTDGTASYSGPSTRQTWLNKIYDVSLGGFYPTDESGDYFTIAVGNQTPNEIEAIPEQQAFSGVPWEGPILDDYVDDPEGDALVYDVTLGDVPPTGTGIETLVLNAGEPDERTVQRFRGTAALGQEGTYNIVIRATDTFGAQRTLTAFTLTVDQGIEVPTVDTGATTLTDALEDIANAGFSIADIVPQVNGATVGNVFDQDPEGGTYAAAGSGITLYVSGIELPNVVGDDLSNAQTELSAAGLQVEIQHTRTASYAPETVISQTPSAMSGDPPMQVVVLPDQIVTLLVAREYPISLVKTITRKRFQ